MAELCATCGSDLQKKLLKCPVCQSYQGAQCNNCGLRLPPGAKRCTVCKTYQTGTACANCGCVKPDAELRCPECSAYGDWRWWLPRSEVVLALILSILSMLAAVVPPVVRWWRDRSDTEVRVLGVHDHKPGGSELAASVPMIRVGVTNSGTRPSFVRSAAITFGPKLGLGATPVNLIIDEVRERYVRPDETSYLHLSSDAFTGKNFNAAVLTQEDITITLDIEETLRLGGKGVEVRDHKVRANNIERWLTHGTR